MESQVKQTTHLGMELDEWTLKSAIAHFSVGDSLATLYDIFSGEKNNGYAQMLLREAKEYYEVQGKKVGGTAALNPTMKHIYKNLGYVEYE